ncbi:MAG: DUF2970 domain-containing protein [Burkholderiales bacterium]
MSASEPNGNASAAKEAGPLKRRANPLDVAKTVLSGFFGVGRRARHESVKLTPAQVIVAGLIAAAVFVGSLVLLVNFVLSSVGPGG